MKEFFKKAWKVLAGVGIAAGVVISTGGSHPTPAPPTPEPIPVPQPAPTADAGERGRITVHDRQFWTEDGQPWTWVGVTDFLLYARFLDGQDITPQLTQRVDVGAKVLRVFGMVDAFSKTRREPFARFYPQEHPDYYTKLAEFLKLCHRYALRVEFVLFADAQAVMPDRAMQDAYAERVFGVLSTATPGFTQFLEGCNECVFESNLPGREARSYEVTSRFRGRSPDVLVASGSSATDLAECSTTVPYVLDYVTEHLDRGDEWPRKHVNLREHRDGFTWGENTPCSGRLFAGTRVPTVSDEPRGLDETVWGSRTTNTVAAGQAGGVAAMMGNGITFHSQSGLLSELLGPSQLKGAKAMLTAARFIPPQVQTLNYARGSDQGPCTWAYGASPVEHDEGAGKRSYAKWVGADYWVVQAGSTRDHVTPCPGFALVAEPVQGVAHLRQR